MLDRSIEISSQELLQANAETRAILQAFPDLFFRLHSGGVIRDVKGGESGDFLVPRECLLGKRMQDVPNRTVGPYGWLPEGNGAMVMRPICRRAGLVHYSWHRLRYTTACRLLDTGMTEEAVMAITGHSSVRDLRGYARRSDASVRRELDLISGKWTEAVSENTHRNTHEAELEVMPKAKSRR